MPPTNIIMEMNPKNRLKFPYEIKDVEPETNKKLLRDFTGEKTTFVQVGPKQYVLPSKYREVAEDIYNFKVRPDDVWVVTFPRSGTTWTQEMVWLLANELDFNTAAEVSLLERFPFFEYTLFVHKEMKATFLEENRDSKERTKIVQEMDTPVWETLENYTGRRFIKTHLPFSLLPPDLLTCGCKVIYVARNPKDVSVSLYHLSRLMRTTGYVNDFTTFWNYFENGLVAWTPYWEHLKEGWEERDEKNLLFLFYEDMNKDLRGAIKQLSSLFNKTLSDEQLCKLEDHLDIKNFRSNKSVNFDVLNSIGVSVKGEQPFIRQGKSGGWKENFDEDTSARADEWIEANLERTDMRFPRVK